MCRWAAPLAFECCFVHVLFPDMMNPGSICQAVGGVIEYVCVGGGGDCLALSNTICDLFQKVGTWILLFLSRFADLECFVVSGLMQQFYPRDFHPPAT